MNTEGRKVVIIGPESTGKSTLAQQLATHYNSLWVPEYAREYLLANGMRYEYDDLLVIAKGQLLLEETYEEKAFKPSKPGEADTRASFSQPPSPMLFLDTDMYVMKVWCEYVFGKCHLWILDQVVNRKYDLYLLCNTDLPWIKDELREYPDLENRQKLYLMYKDILINQHLPWVEISGNNENRLQGAIAGIEKHLL